MKCLCGSELIWNDDFDFEDIGIGEDGIVSSYSCSDDDCDITVEVIQPLDGK